MQSKGNQPTAVQKEWREEVRSLGPIGCEIHHCVGVTGKHNKVEIGHWWILPLSPEQHRDIHSRIDRKLHEKTLFGWMLAKYEAIYGAPPVPPEVLEAIRGYRR